MSSFSSILNTPADSVTEPKEIPVGTWRFVVKNVKKIDPRDEDTPGAILFVMEPVEPGPDVDESELADFEMEGYPVFHRQRIRDRRDAFRLRKFLEALGVELDGRTLEAAAESAVGYEVMAYVEHNPGRDGDTIFVNLTDFASV